MLAPQQAVHHINYSLFASDEEKWHWMKKSPLADKTQTTRNTNPKNRNDYNFNIFTKALLNVCIIAQRELSSNPKCPSPELIKRQ